MTEPTPQVEPTRRVTLKAAGRPYSVWTEVEVVRDLSETCGSFHLMIDDLGRTVPALPASGNLTDGLPFKPFQKAEILIDGELVLVGWIDIVVPTIDGTTVGATVQGRDVVGDLIDCAAAPKGPVEYHKIKLEALAEKLCAPFGITVKVEVDTGEPFDKVSIDAAETAMSVLEKYARKRRVLIVSDGIGSIILTRSGTTQAPADIRFGGNVLSGHGTFDGRKRFSHVYVKGQAGHAAGKRKKAAKLDRTAAPLDAPPAGEADADAATGRESRGVAIMGVAQDDEVGRWRPTVRSPRAKGVLKDAKAEAEWYVSTERGKSETIEYQVHDWRANGQLWRPNQMTHVADPYQAVDKDLLIAGVSFSHGQRGTLTSLRVTGREAYDVLPEDEDDDGGDGKGDKEKSTDIDKTAEPL